MGKVTVFDRPLIKYKLTILRDRNTGGDRFGQLALKITALICYEVARDFKLENCKVETPIGKTTGRTLSGKELGIVSTLRTGLGVVEGLLSVLPATRAGCIGLYRDPKTSKPVEYYYRLPKDVEEGNIIVIDPMPTTSRSTEVIITFLEEHGCENIELVNTITASEGVKMIQEKHPDVNIYMAGLDEKLNDHGCIVPGLGSTGNRLFGTK